MATIDRAPWSALVDDDGSNLVGTVWNKDKIKTVLLDPIDAAIAPLVPPVLIGQVTAIPFNASDFSVYPSGSWTVTAGQVTAFHYSRIEKQAIVAVYLIGSVVAGAPTHLIIKLPFTAAVRTFGPARIVSAGVELINGYTDGGYASLNLQRISGAFAAATYSEITVTMPVLIT